MRGVRAERKAKRAAEDKIVAALVKNSRTVFGQEELLPLHKVAKLLGVHVNTVRWYIERKEWQPVIVGSKFYARKSDLEMLRTLFKRPEGTYTLIDIARALRCNRVTVWRSIQRQALQPSGWHGPFAYYDEGAVSALRADITPRSENKSL